MKQPIEPLEGYTNEKDAAWRQHIKKMVCDLNNLQLGVTKSSVTTHCGNMAPNSDYCLEVTFEVAEQPLTWQLLFSKEEPQFPPDFIFDEEISDGFIVEPDKLESVCNWNSERSSSLSNLLNEVYNKFMDYQMSLVSNYPQLDRGWEEFLLETDYAQDSEVFVQKNGPGTFNAVIKLIFILNVDLAEVVPTLKELSMEGDHSYLSITFNPPDLSSVTPELHLSALINRFIGGSNNLRIPAYGSSSLKAYVTKVHTLLINTVSIVYERLSSRKKLLAAFVFEFKGAVLEYDAEFFREISFQLDDQGFQFTVHVLLNEQFPTEKPVVTLEATDDATSETYRMECSEFEYEDDWPFNQVVENIRNSIIDNVDTLKQESISSAK